MKLSQTITCLMMTTSVICSNFLIADSVKAAQYRYNQYVGKVYIKDANVDFNDNGVTLSVNIRTPTCPNQYHIDGSVTVTYNSPGGGNASRRWRFNGSDEEGIDQYFSDYVAYRQNPGGRVRVSTTSDCVYHGVNHGPLNLPW